MEADRHVATEEHVGDGKLYGELFNVNARRTARRSGVLISYGNNTLLGVEMSHSKGFFFEFSATSVVSISERDFSPPGPPRIFLDCNMNIYVFPDHNVSWIFVFA